MGKTFPEKGKDTADNVMGCFVMTDQNTRRSGDKTHIKRTRGRVGKKERLLGAPT